MASTSVSPELASVVRQLWMTPQSWLLVLLCLALLGAVGGSIRAKLLSPTDEQIALFFDRRLGAAQELVAAIDPTTPGPFRSCLSQRASPQLDTVINSGMLPGYWRNFHLSLPVTVVVGVLLLNLPTPAPAALPEVGTRSMRLHNDDDLVALEHLDEAPGLSEHTRAELRTVTQQAAELRKKLQDGVSQREALADVAQLQNTVSEGLAELNAPEQRAGLEAAVAVLRQQAQTSSAAQALESFGARALDEEMRRLSSAEERFARQQAKQALEEAERAARAHNADTISRQLSEQLELWDNRTDAAQQVHDLIRSIEERSEKGDARRKDPAKAEALTTPEADGAQADLAPGQDDGKAERLSAGLEHSTVDFSGPDAERLERASRLASRAERQALTKALAKLQQPSPAAKREQALMDASQALSRLQSALSDRPSPLPTPTPGPNAPAPRDTHKRGASSSGESAASGDHQGQSQRVNGTELQAKTEQSMDLRRGQVTATVGRSVATATRETLVPTPQALHALGPEQIESVERARVPSEYREQVSRYFSAD